MAEPRITADRGVQVAGADGHPVAAQARVWWLPDNTYRLELTGPWGTVDAEADDQFEALTRVRRELEPLGWRVLVQGARRDTYPSGMMRDQGGGAVVYELHAGRPTTKDDVRPTLDPAPVEQVGTVAEQERTWNDWYGWCGARRPAPVVLSGPGGGARLPWRDDGDVPGRGRHRRKLVAAVARAVRRGLRRGR